MLGYECVYRVYGMQGGVVIVHVKMPTWVLIFFTA